MEILFDYSKDDFITKRYIAEFALSFSNDSINNLNENNQAYFRSVLNNLRNFNSHPIYDYEIINFIFI